MGEDFGEYPYQIDYLPKLADWNFVSAVRNSTLITGSGRGNFVEYKMFYTPESNVLLDQKPDYNIHTQGFRFPNAAVIEYRGSERQSTPIATKMETVWHITDEETAPVLESDFTKIGLMKKYQVHDMSGMSPNETRVIEVSQTVNEYYEPETQPGVWPANLRLPRLKKTKNTAWAPNKSRRSDSTIFLKYDPSNNQPWFTKTSVGGKWYLNQTLFQKDGNSKGLPIGKYSFRFDTQPSDATLNGWPDPSKPFDQDGAAQKTLSASRMEYDGVFPYMVKKVRGWRDSDPTLDDDELKGGVEPIFDNTLGWEDKLIIEKRNSEGAPLEIRQPLSDVNGLHRYTATFYEGLRNTPVGTVDNCFLDEAAILMGENIQMGPLDNQGRWSWTVNPTGSWSSSQFHTGRYGITVNDNPGIKTEIKLVGGVNLTSDYVVSAWMFSNTANKPKMSVQRFKKTATSSTALNTVSVSDPVGGQAFVSKKWQRYEIRITVAQLKGTENLFATVGSGDFLRVTIGSGPTASDGRTVFVDDVVCKPANSTFRMTAFNGRGSPIHSISNTHLVTTYEYDTFGSVSGVRDERNRIYGSSAIHNPGELD